MVLNNVHSACGTPKYRKCNEGGGTAFLQISEGLRESCSRDKTKDGCLSVYFTSVEGNTFSQMEMLTDELALGRVLPGYSPYWGSSCSDWTTRIGVAVRNIQA